MPVLRALETGRTVACHRAEEILAGDLGQISAGDARKDQE
jgi:hypothetical protein